MYLKFLLICSLFYSSSLSFSQSVNSEQLDNYLETLAEHNKFMGSVAIAYDGQIIYNKTVGYKDIEQQQLADNQTVYGIGSISKTFTATLIFKAIEQKKLTLETTINRFFPTIKHAEKITIGQLLNHSSGIYSLTDDATYLKWNTKKISGNQLVKKIAKGGSNFEPGSKSEYSNSNYILLSLILEEIFHTTYADILATYISQPLQLTSISLGNAEMNNKAISYSYKGNWVRETKTHPSIPLGAGAIVSTASDLVRFAHALFNGNILTNESLQSMGTFKDGYGLGTFEFPYEDHMGIGHDGAIDGFRSLLISYNNEKITYAIISNAANYKIDLISQTILNGFFHNVYEIPSFKQIHLSKEELNQYTGVYAHPEIPFKITVSQQDLVLTAQATGQSAFPLEAADTHVFTFDRVGIKITFLPEKNALVLSQSGQEIEFTKE